MGVTFSRRALVGLVAAVAVAAASLTAGAMPDADAQSPPEPAPTVVFLARADNPVDALGAGSIAGTLGGPVLLTGSRSLDAAAADALRTIRPDLVVLAGGTSALSAQVEADVQALDLATRRVSGAGRTQTAAALAAFAMELGTGRPVLTGRPVEDSVIPGLNAERVGGLTAAELRGQAGTAGPAGPPGADGVDGKDGVDGLDGKDGVDGQDGAAGPPGAPGPQWGDTVTLLAADGTPEENGAALRAVVDGLTGSTTPHTIHLAAGSYAMGDEVLALPAGVDLAGAGRDRTEIVFAFGATDGVGLHVPADGEARDLAVEATGSGRSTAVALQGGRLDRARVLAMGAGGSTGNARAVEATQAVTVTASHLEAANALESHGLVVHDEAVVTGSRIAASGDWATGVLLAGDAADISGTDVTATATGTFTNGYGIRQDAASVSTVRGSTVRVTSGGWRLGVYISAGSLRLAETAVEAQAGGLTMSALHSQGSAIVHVDASRLKGALAIDRTGGTVRVGASLLDGEIEGTATCVASYTATYTPRTATCAAP